jgi:hypothetical protein
MNKPIIIEEIVGSIVDEYFDGQDCFKMSKKYELIAINILIFGKNSPMERFKSLRKSLSRNLNVGNSYHQSLNKMNWLEKSWHRRLFVNLILIAYLHHHQYPSMKSKLLRSIIIL